MIIKHTAWNYAAFYKSKHPEHVAIRNIISQNPQHNFILVGHGRHYEHFRFGNTLFYNLGSGNAGTHFFKIRFLFSFFMNFWLPLMLRPSVIVGIGVLDEVPMAAASIITRAKFISAVGSEVWYSVSELPSLTKSLFKVLLRASFNASYATLAISDSIRKELIEDYKARSQKVFVYKYRISDIFNAHVPNDFGKILNPNGPIVLTVCRISPEKGLQYLIEAASTAIMKIPNARFVIRAYSSETEYKDTLLNLISIYNLQKHFKIIEEFSSYEEIPRYMAAADIFVLPSVSEGLGIVVLEAMACGLPVIGTRVGGIPDMITDNYNGLLVEPKDAQGLAKAIIQVLSDEKMRQRLSYGALATTQRIQENEFQSLLTKLIFS
jgi:glycosyltransferase involved in cell wall biosynthesis